jgi:hypothetical protein
VPQPLESETFELGHLDCGRPHPITEVAGMKRSTVWEDEDELLPSAAAGNTLCPSRSNG